jgi:hypothetical protein
VPWARIAACRGSLSHALSPIKFSGFASIM